MNSWPGRQWVLLQQRQKMKREYTQEGWTWSNVMPLSFACYQTVCFVVAVYYSGRIDSVPFTKVRPMRYVYTLLWLFVQELTRTDDMEGLVLITKLMRGSCVRGQTNEPDHIGRRFQWRSSNVVHRVHTTDCWPHWKLLVLQTITSHSWSLHFIRLH